MLRSFTSISQCNSGASRVPLTFCRGFHFERYQPVAGAVTVDAVTKPAAARPGPGTSRCASRALPAGPCARPPLPTLRSRARPLRRRHAPSPLASSTGVATTWADEPEKHPQPQQRPAKHAEQELGFFAATALAVRTHLRKLDGLWGKFVPMAVLFFLMAFVNTIIDSLKDSLVITAVGGGTQVIPYLTVYGVLPSSLVFLVLYSWGTQRYSRERLFNIILGFFVVFYAGFGLLYPQHEALHLTGLGESLVKVLPSGLSGAVGMVRNWLFTLFYCMSELWGDVMLSLLFWGLANETTSIEDAPLLYPLFGIGANVAQTVAGRVLRLLSATSGGSHSAYTTRVQFIMALCVGMGVAIMALHRFISRTFPLNPKGSTALRVAAQRAQQARQVAAGKGEGAGVGGLAAGLRGGVAKGLELGAARPQPGAGGEVHFAGGGGIGKMGIAASWRTAPAHSNGRAHGVDGSSSSSNGLASHAHTSSSSLNGNGNGPAAQHHPQQQQQQAAAPAKPPQAGSSPKKAMTLRDAFLFLKRSPQIRCLAVMALAQGITCNLLDLTFKHHLHKLYSSPAAYSAFLGDTAMWTGIVTGSLMFASPLMFDRLGWKGVAAATPNFMMYAGVPFFAGCVAYNFMAGSLLGAGAVTLKALVITGALLHVVARGAKFSLFKPAEEMVYIGLDDESRTKGKAAIDVVGAQSGKSTGSMLQQALLILSGGTLGGILPVLTILYLLMLSQWKRSVAELGDHHDPSHAHRMSVMGSIDSDDPQGGSSTPPTDLEASLEEGGGQHSVHSRVSATAGHSHSVSHGAAAGASEGHGNGRGLVEGGAEEGRWLREGLRGRQLGEWDVGEEGAAASSGGGWVPKLPASAC